MSEIQKCPNLVRGGGGQNFSKMSQIQKCPKGRKGGGSTLIGTLSQIFSIFYFDGSPNLIVFLFFFLHVFVPSQEREAWFKMNSAS